MIGLHWQWMAAAMATVLDVAILFGCQQCEIHSTAEMQPLATIAWELPKTCSAIEAELSACHAGLNLVLALAKARLPWLMLSAKPPPLVR